MPDIILVLLILGIALVLFVTEVIWMDLVSLLVLVTLAVTGPPYSKLGAPGKSNTVSCTWLK